MTFSLAARCARTGMFGVVVVSSSPAVAARCVYVQAGVGAACTQNITDPRLGPALLKALAEGAGAAEALSAVTAGTPHREFRQLSVVDSRGSARAFSGSGTLGVHAGATGDDVVAAGNLLADPGIPQAMVDAFGARPEHHLGDRLLDGLRAAARLRGEAGPVHSAGMLLADTVPWPTTDLRVDHSDDPIGDLAALWAIWAPMAEDYVTRALDPTVAPSFGVPGDR
jgi:uncharacterized Ntn-hydrolase superfamily protein